MIRIISESLEYQRVAVFVHILPRHTNYGQSNPLILQLTFSHNAFSFCQSQAFMEAGAFTHLLEDAKRM